MIDTAYEHLAQQLRGMCPMPPAERRATILLPLLWSVDRTILSSSLPQRRERRH